MTKDSNLLQKFFSTALHGLGGHALDAHRKSFANEWDRTVKVTGEMWKNKHPFFDAH